MQGTDCPFHHYFMPALLPASSRPGPSCPVPVVMAHYCDSNRFLMVPVVGHASV